MCSDLGLCNKGLVKSILDFKDKSGMNKINEIKTSVTTELTNTINEMMKRKFSL